MMARTEEDLEVSLEQDIEALKAQALESAPQALTLIDLQGKRLWANKAFCQLLGKPLEALLGVSVELAYPLEEQDRVKRAIVQETIQKDGIKNFETWFEKDGKKVYVQIHTSLIRDEQGRPNAIVYSAADISAQRSRMEVLLDSLAKWSMRCRFIRKYPLRQPILCSLHGETQRSATSRGMAWALSPRRKG